MMFYVRFQANDTFIFTLGEKYFTYCTQSQKKKKSPLKSTIFTEVKYSTCNLKFFIILSYSLEVFVGIWTDDHLNNYKWHYIKGSHYNFQVATEDLGT